MLAQPHGVAACDYLHMTSRPPGCYDNTQVQSVCFASPNKHPVRSQYIWYTCQYIESRKRHSPPSQSPPLVPLPEGLLTPQKPCLPCSELRWAPATAVSPSPPEPQQCCARESSSHAQLLSPPVLLDPHPQEVPLLPLRATLGCSSLQENTARLKALHTIAGQPCSDMSTERHTLSTSTNIMHPQA